MMVIFLLKTSLEKGFEKKKSKNRIQPQKLMYIWRRGFYVGIKSLKKRHDVIMLDLTVSLLSFWYIDIDLNIQLIYLILYMICVH